MYKNTRSLYEKQLHRLMFNCEKLPLFENSNLFRIKIFDKVASSFYGPLSSELRKILIFLFFKGYTRAATWDSNTSAAERKLNIFLG